MKNQDEVKKELGETISVGVGEIRRHVFEAKCDEKIKVISQTNGKPHTIYWPKNAGTCLLKIVSIGKDKKPIAGTELELSSGEDGESYTSPDGAQAIAFYCMAKLDMVAGSPTPTCILEIDRR
jgi:hypothetical protein